MKKALMIGIIMGNLLLGIAGCMFFSEPWRMQFLRKAEGRASQEEVSNRLGDPLKTEKLSTGGEVWTYEDCIGRIGSHSCVRYFLTFDDRLILREWKSNEYSP